MLETNTVPIYKMAAIIRFPSAYSLLSKLQSPRLKVRNADYFADVNNLENQYMTAFARYLGTHGRARMYAYCLATALSYVSNFPDIHRDKRILNLECIP